LHAEVSADRAEFDLRQSGRVTVPTGVVLAFPAARHGVTATFLLPALYASEPALNPAENSEHRCVARSSARPTFVFAVGVAALAVVISPWAIEWVTGRAELSFRVQALSLAFDAFLVVLAGALLARGRLRELFFHLMFWAFPLALLATMEMAAISIGLADRIAPTEDLSLLDHKGQWPADLMAAASRAPKVDGVMLYRPWQGEGVSINQLGLRTEPPTAKAPGEQRIAITGGSAAWGWRVRDADTISVLVQQALRRAGANVTVYNFGLEAQTIAQERMLLERFRDAYAIDQVLFYTGANNVVFDYLGTSGSQGAAFASETTGFELVKAARRLSGLWSRPSAADLALLDDDALPRLVRDNSLREGIIAADAYCSDAGLQCDFALQPLLLMRQPRVGPEVRVADTLERLYPRLRTLAEQMYRDARAAGPQGRVHDLSAVFDRAAAPVFVDVVHVNESGNRIIADAVASILAHSHQ
jgi:hypothetical protein